MASSRSQGFSFSRWRRRRQLYRESKHLVRETRRILKKFRNSLKKDVIAEAQKAVDAVTEAMRGGGIQPVQESAERLEKILDKHLAFGRKSALREYTESIGVAVIIALLLRAFVVEAFKIPSPSMFPTLEVGDHIFVNKFIYGLRVPLANYIRIPMSKSKFVNWGAVKRGEVIVFVYPKDESKDFIKRVVAIGGDTVAMRNDVIYVNGKPVNRRKLPGPCSYLPRDEEGRVAGEPIPCVAYEEEQSEIRYRALHNLNSPPMFHRAEKVPKGHVFVMGDNRENSHDSRYWGTVPYSHIKGRAMIIWWSSGDPDGVRWHRFFSLLHADTTLDPIRPEDTR